MKLIGNQPISIIQGDTKDYKIKFDDDINDLIESIFLTSEDLDINEKMTFSEDEKTWTYKFGALKTQIDPSDFYSYDITINFKDGDILSETKIPLKIIKKENPVDYNQLY